MTSITLTHGDIDGITAGAVDMLAFPGAEFYFSRPSQIHLDLSRIAKDQPENVVVSDIAMNATRTTEILDALRHLSQHYPLDRPSSDGRFGQEGTIEIDRSLP